MEAGRADGAAGGAGIACPTSGGGGTVAIALAASCRCADCRSLDCCTFFAAAACMAARCSTSGAAGARTGGGDAVDGVDSGLAWATTADDAPCTAGADGGGLDSRSCQASPATSTRLAALPSVISQRGARLWRLAASIDGIACVAILGWTQSPGSRGPLRRSVMVESSGLAKAAAAARSTAASSAGEGSFCGNCRYNAANSVSPGSGSSAACGSMGGRGVLIRITLRVVGSWHSAGVTSPSRVPRR